MREEEAKRQEMEKRHQELRMAEQSNLAAIREQVVALAQRSNQMSDTFQIDDEKNIIGAVPTHMRQSHGLEVRESPNPKIMQGINSSPDKINLPPSYPSFEMGRNMEL